jgi:Flp pilus assembly protein TadD
MAAAASYFRSLGIFERFIMKRSFFAFAVIGLALLAGLVFTVQSSSATTQTNAQAMSAANQLVNAGHYAEAAQMYEQLVAQSPQDAALHYNLGNAYFLQGDASGALAAYEQAAALAPRDADIRANLALAQEAMGPASRPSSGFLAAVAPVVRRWLTADELALLALGAWFALGLLVLVERRHSK